MTNKQPDISIDTRRKEEVRKLFPKPQVLTSHKADWQSLVLEHHRQPAYEMPETIFQQHMTVVSLKTTLVEYKLAGHFGRINHAPGDLTFIPADVHYWAADLSDNEFIFIAMSPQRLLDKGQEIISGQIELIPTFGKADPFVYGLALTLKQELETDYHGCELYAESLTDSLAVHLLRKYASIPAQIKQYGGLAPYKLKLAVNYINDNLDKKIRLDDVAKQIDISQFYFSHMFRESTGIAPYKYIIRQRVKKAKRLIKQNKLSLADIAYECGFTSQSQMIHHFKKCVGVTPKVYRNKCF